MYIPLNPPSKVHTFSFTQTQGFAREPRRLLMVIAYFVISWLFLYFLYRKKIFLKV
ncbi:MAG: hypothetical protein PUC53_07095 [Bacteroidales bacterium]|nr:hypothetical protein [Bacteroidales bacterium]